eukprot:3894668-Rhodomonas_salina.2
MKEGRGPVSAYAAATQSPVLTSRMLLPGDPDPDLDLQRAHRAGMHVTRPISHLTSYVLCGVLY